MAQDGPEDGEALVVSVEGFEGPLDLMLALARAHRLDLRAVSVLALARQYLAFVERARTLRIELAADYLVAAAWLAYLKSRLLLPPDPAGDEPSAEAMAEQLAHRLARLDAMRRAGSALMARDRLGRDVFARGAPEAVARTRRVVRTATLGELLGAYAGVRARDGFRPLALDRPEVWSLEAARERLRERIGRDPGWRGLATFLPPDWTGTASRRRSATASAFAASLELARTGALDLRQAGPGGVVDLRPRRGGG